ncbi:hypothetical protein [Nesterenkonia sp. K-15-9-6]|uniref:hypothetical protein n=1 Tax=Nesterenkonia sp. K-15-9-6 TaxID=3093918 RepID=UPI00404436D3
MPQPAQPQGVRSSRNLRLDPDGGTNVWVQHESFAMEWKLLEQGKFDSEMTFLEQLDAMAQLTERMELAADGKCKFPSRWLRRRDVDADEISRHGNYLLELRHVPESVNRTPFGKVQRVVRVYYYEPKLLDEVLAALALGSKPDGPDTGMEQNKSIDLANSRAWDWDVNETLRKQGCSR